jgi:hypothetical protein
VDPSTPECDYQFAGGPVSDRVLYGDCLARFAVVPNGATAFGVTGPVGVECAGQRCVVYIECGAKSLPAGPFVVTALAGPNEGLRSEPFTVVGGDDPDGDGPDGPTSCGPVFQTSADEQAPS